MRRRSRLARAGAILERLPKFQPTRAVEVGVFRGDLSRILLRARPQLTLYMVDLWAHNPDLHYHATGALGADLLRRDWRRIFSAAMRVVWQFQGRAIPLRFDSVAAAEFIRDGSLDLAFVDDDHSEQGCTRSIEAYLPKVRPGGWVGGHDYGTTGKRKRYQFRVTEAVHGIFDQKDIEVGVDTTWFVRKP